LSKVETIMTAKFKFLTALLVLLASWTGQAGADQAPPPQDDQVAVSTDSGRVEAPDRLAWQRVGSPLTLEG
jgi:hypothetical protein